MTPHEFLQRYWNLEVPVENEQGITQWVTVKVACYRIGLDSLNSKEKFLDKLRPNLNEKGETVKVKVKSVYGEEEKIFHSRAEIAPFVAAPFYGKGTPEDVQIVLQLAVRYGLIGSSQLEIQNYCDVIPGDKTKQGRIGLDCSGFVGNFLQQTVGGMPWDEKPATDKSWTSEGIPSLLPKVGTRIKAMKDFNFNSVYVFGLADKNGNVIRTGAGKEVGHIMITQPFTLKVKPVYMPILGFKIGECPSFQVCESTGRGKGVVESTYNILGVDNKGVFRIWRGSQQEEARVQIYRVWGF